MRATLVICLALLGIASPVSGARRERPQPSREEVRIRQALAAKVDWEFKNQPFRNVVCEIAKVANINIHIPSGVNLNAPVTYRAKGVSVHVALSHILNPLGLDFEIRDEIVRIRPTLLLVSDRTPCHAT